MLFLRGCIIIGHVNITLRTVDEAGPPLESCSGDHSSTLGEGSLWFDRNHIQSSNNSKLNEAVLSHVICFKKQRLKLVGTRPVFACNVYLYHHKAMIL